LLSAAWPRLLQSLKGEWLKLLLHALWLLIDAGDYHHAETRIKLESAVSIQRPFVVWGLSRAHRNKQALRRRSIGTDSFLKITN
jgi:hypothetical protein